MAKNDETFELIRAMSANEKRFFRLSSIQTGKETNYLRVFSAIDSLDEFDQEKLKKKLNGKKLNLSYEKNYLHKQLIRSLRHFYSDNNSAMELQDILKSLEILYRKRLNTQCQKLISRGIEISKLYEHWNYQLELMDWQWRLYSRTGNYKLQMEYAGSGLAEKEGLAQKIILFARRQEEIGIIRFTIRQSGNALNEAEKKKFKQISMPCPGKDLQQSGFRINEIQCSVQYLLHHYLGDMEEAYKWSRAAMELYVKHPQFITDQPFKYFAGKNSLINRCIYLGKFEEMFRHIDELKKIIRDIPAFKQQDIQDEHQLMLLLWYGTVYFKMGRREEALKIAKTFKLNYSQKRIRESTRLAADSYLARIYFYNGEYKESLRFVNKQLREGMDALPPDFLMFAFLLRICIYIELENETLLDSQVGAVKRFLKKRSMKDNFALRFIELLSKRKDLRGEKAQQLFWKDSCKRMAKMVSPETDQYEVIVDWMKSKIL